MIMKVFEQKLLGCHWNKHHLPFICFAEQGSGTVWHYHILFNQGKFSEKELENAISEARAVLKLPLYCLYLENINCSEDRVKNYCHKEVEIYWNGKVNSDRFILSADLFNLPYKKTSSINWHRCHIMEKICFTFLEKYDITGISRKIESYSTL